MNPRCILCGAKTRKVHDPNCSTCADYYSCSHCEFISIDEAFILSSEDELKRYDSHNNSIDDPRYVKFFVDFLQDAVLGYANESKRGLDFGSGPSPVLAEILERHYGYQMDIYDLFYSPTEVYLGRKYDLITSTEVVEHLRHPLEYFKLFKDLLKPAGILAIMTLFHHNDDAQFLKWYYIRDRSHISFYTLKTMEYIAEQVGLNVIYTNEVRYVTFALKA